MAFKVCRDDVAVAVTDKKALLNEVTEDIMGVLVVRRVSLELLELGRHILRSGQPLLNLDLSSLCLLLLVLDFLLGLSSFCAGLQHVAANTLGY